LLREKLQSLYVFFGPFATNSSLVLGQLSSLSIALASFSTSRLVHKPEPLFDRLHKHVHCCRYQYHVVTAIAHRTLPLRCPVVGVPRCAVSHAIALNRTQRAKRYFPAPPTAGATQPGILL
jgi:hypothetical protein